MKLPLLIAGLLVCTAGLGCSGNRWLAAPSWPLGKQDSDPQTVAEMLDRQPEQNPTSAARATDSPKPSRADAHDFVERMATARSAEQAAKWDTARDFYQKLIVDFPERPEPYHRLGVVADRQQRHREAQSLFTESLQRQIDAEVFNDLGYCFYLQGKLAKAESALMKAVSLSPAEGRYRNNLGMVLGHMGRDDEALVQFRRAGSEADAQYNLAFVQVIRGEVEEARKRLQIALLSDPRHEQARLAFEELKDFDPTSPTERISQAPPRAGRHVPYLEEVGETRVEGTLTSGNAAAPGETFESPLQVVPGEFDNAGQPIRNTFASSHRGANHAGSDNAAVRSLEQANFNQATAAGPAVRAFGSANSSAGEAQLPANFHARTQALQAQARAMLEARTMEGR